MPRSGRGRFLGLIGGGTAALFVARAAEGQAPPKPSPAGIAADRRGLAAALRELNAQAGLGVTAEDLDRAEDYATGALVEAEKKLRALRLPEGLDLPVVFRARRRP